MKLSAPSFGYHCSSRNYYEDDDETERRESYALDEVNAMKTVPLAKNANHHKRVSL